MTSRQTYQENASPSDTQYLRVPRPSTKQQESTPRSFQSPHSHAYMTSNPNVDPDKYRLSSPDISLKPFKGLENRSLQASPAYFHQRNTFQCFTTPQSEFIYQKQDLGSYQSRHRPYNSQSGASGRMQSPSLNFMASPKYNKPADLLSPQRHFHGLTSEERHRHETIEEIFTAEDIRVAHVRKETDDLLNDLLSKYAGGENKQPQFRSSVQSVQSTIKPKNLAISITDLMKNVPTGELYSTKRQERTRKDPSSSSPFYSSPSHLQFSTSFPEPRIVISHQKGEEAVEENRENLQEWNERNEVSSFNNRTTHDVERSNENITNDQQTETRFITETGAQENENERTNSFIQSTPNSGLNRTPQQDTMSYDYTKGSVLKSDSSNLKEGVENIEIAYQGTENQQSESNTDLISNQSNAGSDVADFSSLVSPSLVNKANFLTNKLNWEKEEKENRQEENVKNVLGNKRTFGTETFENVSNIMNNTEAFKEIKDSILKNTNTWEVQDKENIQTVHNIYKRSGTKNQETAVRQTEPVQLFRAFTFNQTNESIEQTQTQSQQFNHSEKENIKSLENLSSENKWSDLTQPLLPLQQFEQLKHASEEKQLYYHLQENEPKVSEPKEMEQQEEIEESSEAPYCLEEDEELEDVEIQKLNEQEKMIIEERTKEIKERLSTPKEKSGEIEKKSSFTNLNGNEEAYNQQQITENVNMTDKWEEEAHRRSLELLNKEEIEYLEPISEERIKKIEETQFAEEGKLSEKSSDKLEVESQSSTSVVSEVKRSKSDAIKTYAVILGIFFMIFLWHFVIMWEENLPEDREIEILDLEL